MNAQQMLAMGGFPDTAEGRQAFYNQYPDEASFHKKMKTGGSSLPKHQTLGPVQPNPDASYRSIDPNTIQGALYQKYMLNTYGRPGTAPTWMQQANIAEGHELLQDAMDKVAEQTKKENNFSSYAPDWNYVQAPPSRKEIRNMINKTGIGYDGLGNYYDMLDNMQKGYKRFPGYRREEPLYEPSQYGHYEKGGLAFPQQPTAAEFYAPQYTPNSPVGFYKHGGLAYPQQPPADMFFSGHPFTPEYARGGMPCMDCGGYMDDGGQSSPFNYGEMPPTIGMAYGGSAKSFSKAMKKHFADGGNAPQGSSMEQNYLTNTNNLKRFIGGNVTNALATEAYDQEQQEPVYDLGGEDTFNYGRADQLEAMQNNLGDQTAMAAYQKKQNLSNLINSYQMGGLPQAQMGTISDADRSKRMFGTPDLGKKTAPLYFGHTQGATAANATSGSLNPELTAKGNQLAQDIHNFNPSGAGVQFTPEQIKYLQQHGYFQQQQNSVWNPGYKVRAKGWENSADGTKGNKWRSKGTSDSPFPTFGPGSQGPTFGPGSQGPGSFNMSRGLNEQQVADMNKYYNAHGMHMDYKQKNGLLGKWLGPKSYEMHIGSLSDHNQKNPAQSAQSATAASSSNPSGGGFHPFDGMRKRMAERKAGRSARIAARGERMSDEAEKAFDAQHPEFNGGYQKQHGGAPSVYFPHGYQQGGFNEVENDDYVNDDDYEYMDENEIAEYIAAGGQIKYV